MSDRDVCKGSLMDIELVVCDMAGTTVHDSDTVNRCIRASLSEVGLSVTAAAVNVVMGLPKPEAIALLIEQSDRREELRPRIDAIHHDFVRRSIQLYEHDPSLCEVAGATRVFEKLRTGGILVALNTGFSRSITDVILDRLGWSGAA